MTRVKEIEQVVSQVQSEDISRGDVFIGPVGIGLMLASFSETPNQILENLDHIIRNDSPSNLLSGNGLAHGNLGVIWAQFRLSYALKNTERCKYFFNKASQVSFPNTAGWCNGNAGLLMVLAEMAKILNEQVDLHELAKKSTALPTNGPIDLSICHGAAGVLQSVAINPSKKNSMDYTELGMVKFGKEDILFGTVELEQPYFDPEDPKNDEYVLVITAFSCNYRDKALLLNNYNTIKGSDRLLVPFGSEFSAIIVNIGMDVHDFKVGDRVMSDCSYPDSGKQGVLPGVATNLKKYKKYILAV